MFPGLDKFSFLSIPDLFNFYVGCDCHSLLFTFFSEKRTRVKIEKNCEENPQNSEFFRICVADSVFTTDLVMSFSLDLWKIFLGDI